MNYEIDLTKFTGRAALSHAKREELLDAIDGASDQNRTTFILADGKRIAAIVPVDVAEHDLEAGL